MTSHDQGSSPASDPRIATDVARSAADCAARLQAPPDSFAAALPLLGQAFAGLTDALRQLDQRFAFDREGRPAAIAAVRAALPSIEREILDAVVEDHACELAAMQEALYQIALAYGQA